PGPAGQELHRGPRVRMLVVVVIHGRPAIAVERGIIKSGHASHSSRHRPPTPHLPARAGPAGAVTALRSESVSLATSRPAPGDVRTCRIADVEEAASTPHLATGQSRGTRRLHQQLPQILPSPCLRYSGCCRHSTTLTGC